MVRDVSSSIGPKAARVAAANIFVCVFPLLLADTVRRAHPIGFHQLHLVSQDSGSLAPGLADDDPRVILGSAWIDLRHGPVVLRLPDCHGRYLNVTLIDTLGDPVGSLGSRTGEDAGAELALVGPNWRGEPPGGLHPRRMTSEIVWIVSRLHARSALDRLEALRVAQLQWLAPVRREPPSAGPLPSFQAPATPCLRQVGEITPAVFFHRLAALLERAPETGRRGVAETASQLARELGGPPPPTAWSGPFAESLAGGFADGFAAIRAAAAAPKSGGWRSLDGVHRDRETPLARGARAYAGLGSPMPEDMLALVCDRDENGRPLLGSHRYRIRFPPDGTPPAREFWWLSAWPAAPFDHRHGLGDRSDLALEPDGSLEIRVQNAPPDPPHIVNWLPTPEGELGLLMRLFSPAEAALAGTWRMPPVERLDFERRAGRKPRAKPDPDDLEGPPAATTRIRGAALAWRMTP